MLPEDKVFGLAMQGKPVALSRIATTRLVVVVLMMMMTMMLFDAVMTPPFWVFAAKGE